MKYFRCCPRILTVAVVVAFVLSGCVVSSTGAPGIVADESAVLTGAVGSSQADTVTYWFNYSAAPNYGSSTTTQTAFVQKGTTTLSEVVDALTAGTATTISCAAVFPTPCRPAAVPTTS
jgi:hypothetical protein